MDSINKEWVLVTRPTTPPLDVSKTVYDPKESKSNVQDNLHNISKLEKELIDLKDQLDRLKEKESKTQFRLWVEEKVKEKQDQVDNEKELQKFEKGVLREKAVQAESGRFSLLKFFSGAPGNSAESASLQREYQSLQRNNQRKEIQKQIDRAKELQNLMKGLEEQKASFVSFQKAIADGFYNGRLGSSTLCDRESIMKIDIELTKLRITQLQSSKAEAKKIGRQIKKLENEKGWIKFLS